jgi:hypothetical protein
VLKAHTAEEQSQNTVSDKFSQAAVLIARRRAKNVRWLATHQLWLIVCLHAGTEHADDLNAMNKLRTCACASHVLLLGGASMPEL